MYRLKRQRNLRSQRGQSLVETAMVIPLLLLLLVGAVDFGRVLHDYITMTNAAREGARLGSKFPWMEAAITAAAQDELTAGGVSANFTIHPTVCTSGTTGAAKACVSAISGDGVQVTIDHQVTTGMLGAVTGMGTINLSSQAQMVVFGVLNPVVP